VRKSAGGRGGGNDKREREELVVALAAEVARDVALRETGAGRSGSVLVFLPGWDEIKEITKTLQVSICIKSRLPVCPYTTLTTFLFTIRLCLPSRC
jgi:HrpA-like RNA helicase